MLKKIKFLKLLSAVGVGFIIFPAMALALEIVDYPTTITGSTITASSDLADYLKYVFDASISVGLIITSIVFVWAGILYFLSPVPGAIEKAKDRLSGAVSGLLILLLTYLIITTINPYLSIFSVNPIKSSDIVIPEHQTYGLKLYVANGCSNLAGTFTANADDIGDFKNKINSAELAQNTTSYIYYVGILFDNTNNWGSCQYIDPNKGCQPAKISVASATVYEYNFYPSSGSVTLYRNSFNSVSGKKEDNKNNGYLTINQGEIKKLYWKRLSDLSFTGNSTQPPDTKTYANENSYCTVPYQERDCVKWSDSGLCTARRCPTLDNENLSSIEINGDYLVVLLYIGPNDDTSNYVYSYCQSFPIKDDQNKNGPQQVKWDAIRSSGRKPNYILIIPVKYR